MKENITFGIEPTHTPMSWHVRVHDAHRPLCTWATVQVPLPTSVVHTDAALGVQALVLVPPPGHVVVTVAA